MVERTKDRQLTYYKGRYHVEGYYTDNLHIRHLELKRKNWFYKFDRMAEGNRYLRWARLMAVADHEVPFPPIAPHAFITLKVPKTVKA